MLEGMLGWRRYRDLKTRIIFETRIEVIYTHVFLLDLSFFFRSEVVLDVEEFTDFFWSLSLDHVGTVRRKWGIVRRQDRGGRVARIEVNLYCLLYWIQMNQPALLFNDLHSKRDGTQLVYLIQIEVLSSSSIFHLGSRTSCFFLFTKCVPTSLSSM